MESRIKNVSEGRSDKIRMRYAGVQKPVLERESDEFSEPGEQ
jgi:hypothetical protein